MQINKRISLKIKIGLGCILFFYINTQAFIENGFVTFATANYFQLLEVLIKSIHIFSEHPVIAYGINEDIPFSTDKYPKLIKKRIDLTSIKFPHIFYQKPNIILKSNIKYGIYIEADDIANFEIDNLFEWCKTIEEFPLCPIHPHDPNNLAQLMKSLNVSNKSMPYVHGHVIFSYKCMKFIEEWYNNCLEYGHIAANADESVLNVLLWKYNVTNLVPLFDPNHEYALNEYFGNRNPHIYYYMIHGCKQAHMARDILSRLAHHAAQKGQISQERLKYLY